ncbi:MAG: IclR family transcriptional regulator [Alphaproteobacteria bacterium]|nr:IclR family transcriptional regulator [Alphaproteobacteria bacterium]
MTQILDHLLESGEPLSPYAIAKGTGAPVSTVYVTIDEMVNARLLSRNADGSIWIGDRLYYYGLAYSSKLQLFEEAKREMTELRDEVKETVQICARDRTSLVVQQMATGPGQFRVASDIGSRLPLNWTASGLLLIGHLPMDERIALMKDSAVESPTGRAETDPTRLAEIAGKVYQDRLAIQDGQADELVCCIASPVCNEEGECLVTISVVLANSKVEKNADYYIAAVTRASQRLERRMGWLG